MSTSISRRSFVRQTSSCGAYLLGLAAFAPAMTKKVFALTQDDDVLAKESWGYIRKLGDNFYALISTLDPADPTSRATVCNGGIIVGQDRVLAIESFMEPKGATWLAKKAKEICGRWPTDVVATHFHGDHTSGVEGYFEEDNSPAIWLTTKTRKSLDDFRKEKSEKEYPVTKELKDDEATEIDLGGSKVKIYPRSGHTSSDVTIELEEPRIVYCGDLFFNRMVPNYRDSSPGQLKLQVAKLVGEKDTIYVPGHGPLANVDDLKNYQEFLNFVEEEARQAFDAGKDADQAAKDFELSTAFKDWYIFAPSVIPAAMDAWYREFKSDQ